MKTLNILLMAAAFSLCACGSEAPAEDQVDEALKEEILQLDSIATETEQAIEEINQSSEELDHLLEDLEN